MSVKAGSVRAVVFNGAGAGTGLTSLVALVEDGLVVAEKLMAGRGASEHFAPAIRELLTQNNWTTSPDRVVAVIGPGSFTGLRSSLSLAAGLAAGWNCPTIGVTLGAAIRATLARPDAVCVSIARRGRVFVDPPHGPVTASQTADLDPTGWACVTGDAVSEKTDWPCPVLPCEAPYALGIVQAAQGVTPGPLMPLYVDPPEAKPPAAGLRPAPL
ncbi:tRNA (adenosine(37)-N6)-threonylcarbamoyltransferase complex dimerization subunit type 1 TsaB [Gluconobacter oxydans]|uniref:tRNA (adenosine(37)-N6)-threonylcarbamoyltransferase complex dimerization subunit type 1 TsaB n=1 Tax=Gluconobacter oxydans TaxID=442 RepID=UPI0039EAE4C1